jgi:mono/diheme cytochrome c family protein
MPALISSFRSPLLRLLLLGVMLPAALATLPAPPPPQNALEESSPTPPPSTPERIQRGRVLFSRHCVSCHGPTGAGDGSAAHDLDPKPSDLRDPAIANKSDVKLFRQITRGRAPMPSFGRLLNDDDRWTLAAFVKTLAKQAASETSR